MTGEIIERYIDVELTEDEVLEYGREQAKTIIDVHALENEKKLITDQIKPRKMRIDSLASMIDSGTENRIVECCWEYDYENKVKQLRRNDNDELYGETITITEEETQQSL